MDFKKYFVKIFTILFFLISSFSFVACDEMPPTNSVSLYPKYVTEVKNAIDKLFNESNEDNLLNPQKMPFDIDMKNELDSKTFSHPRFQLEREKMKELFIKSISYSIGTGELLLKDNEEFIDKIVKISSANNDDFLIKIIEKEYTIDTIVYSSSTNTPYVHAEFYYESINDFYVKVFVYDINDSKNQKLIYLDSSLSYLYLLNKPSFSQSLKDNLYCMYINENFNKGYEFDFYEKYDFDFANNYFVNLLSSEIEKLKLEITAIQNTSIYKTYSVGDFETALDRVFPPEII